MKQRTLPKDVENHKNKWLAITQDEEELVGWGDSPLEALEMAKKKGVEDTIVFWMPEKWPELLVV